MNLRPYQLSAVDTLERLPRAICQIPCGGGKTIVAAEMCRRHAAQLPEYRILWLANTREQVSQANQALELLGLSLAPERVKVVCPAGYPGDAWWAPKYATLLIVDECHHAPAASWAAMIRETKCRRYGFSATPERADDLAPIVHELLGPTAVQIDHEALRATGNVAGGSVVLLRYAASDKLLARVAAASGGDRPEDLWDKDCPDWRKRRHWRALLDQGVVANERRNALIVEGVRYHIAVGNSILVVVPTVAHGQTLCGRIGNEAALVHSKLGKRLRTSLIDEFRDGSILCLVATSLADEGLDVPRANVLFLATANRSARAAEQRAGRVLRSLAGKPEAKIFDFADDWHPWLRGQSKKRAAVYEHMGLVVRYANCDPSLLKPEASSLPPEVAA